MAEEIKKEDVKDDKVEGEEEGSEVPETSESASEEDGGGEDGEDSGLDEEKVDPETLALARLLQNPTTRSAVIAALAKDSDVERKVSEGQSSKQIVRSVKDDLAKSLGKDWEFLAEKLAPMFDGLTNYVAQLEGKLSNQISQSTVESANQAAEKFFASTPEAKKFEGTMIKLMEDYEPPKDSAKLQPYLKRLFILAREENSHSGKALADKVKERIEKNSQQTTLKAGTRDAKEPEKVYKTSREAVLAAMETLNKVKK